MNVGVINLITRNRKEWQLNFVLDLLKSFGKANLRFMYHNKKIPDWNLHC
jgi:hypothetical protein